MVAGLPSASMGPLGRAPPALSPCSPLSAAVSSLPTATPPTTAHQHAGGQSTGLALLSLPFISADDSEELCPTLYTRRCPLPGRGKDRGYCRQGGSGSEGLSDLPHVPHPGMGTHEVETHASWLHLPLPRCPSPFCALMTHQVHTVPQDRRKGSQAPA